LPVVGQQVEDLNTSVAVLATHATEESDFFCGDHSTRVVGNLTDILACGFNLFPADLLRITLVELLNVAQVDTPH
jgi:hypothetical protein